MNVIEISGSAIRLVRERERRLLGLDSWPVPPGADPLLALAAAPLPSPLGRVAVAIHHDDLLVRTLTQPAAAPERLDKLIRFELAGSDAEGADPYTVSWHGVNASFPDGEMRVLALLAKQRLIERLRQSLAAHGGKLVALLPPGLGLYHAWRLQEPDEAGDAALIDVGGKRSHIVLARNGELLFLRTQTPGMDELVKSVAERRGIAEPEAAKIVAKLGKGAPEDLRELVAKQAGALAAAITAAARFARAQLKLAELEPKAIHLSGAGAQVTGFAEALRERAGIPVRLLNPFPAALSAMPTDEMDRVAALPTPWTPAIGAALAPRFELDALGDERARAALFWRTSGALRVAAAVALALFLLAAVKRELDLRGAATAIATLEGEKNDGLVPMAKAELDKLAQLQQARALAADKLGWLDAQRRPGRVAVELLAAIAAQQDPLTCPVVLTAYRVARQGDGIQVELEGYAKSAGKNGTDAVLHEFEQGLRRRYPPISSVVQLPQPVNVDNQLFHYRIAVKDPERDAAKP